MAPTAIDPHDETRWDEAIRVGSDPATPPEVLATLATGHVWARFAVAGNPSTTETTLAALAADDSPAVRHRVALHTSTPAEARTQLTSDHDDLVRAAATAALGADRHP